MTDTNPEPDPADEPVPDEPGEEAAADDGEADPS